MLTSPTQLQSHNAYFYKTTTVTVSASAVSTSASSTSVVSTTTVSTTTASTSAVPTGGYQPAIPSSYDQCVFDPATGGEFTMHRYLWIHSSSLILLALPTVECDGLTSAGIVGGESFDFIVTDNGDLIVLTSEQSKRKNRRDIPVPKGFYVKPKEVETPPGTKCSNPAQHATSKSPPVPLTSNGCGPEGIGGWLVPDGDFTDACNFHDVCWCCNTDFYYRMVDICNARYPAGKDRSKCISRAGIYHSAVSSNYGAGVFTDTINQYCDCVCNDSKLTTCQDKCVDTKTDPQHCGSCNFNCPTGSCTNGACSFNSCTGRTCSTFSQCGPGGDCVCASVTGGLGFCVDGTTPCNGLAGCGTSADCPLGSVCAVSTCCTRNVCIRTDRCGGFGGNIPPNRLMAARGEWTNATIGHLPEYIE
nr:uncharacterized protein CTRU02_14473 [Colletotrichum truncatum]KAF6782143.1 hypothetical protein CTRU02_14473 [Colletotrichum truncatum]